MARSSHTFASLFSGCGGFDLGFKQKGFKPVGAFDIDPQAIRIYEKNRLGPCQLCDLAADSFDWNCLGNPDVLLAGPPCQGFSTVGRRDPEDPRNRLLMRVGEIVRFAKPKVVIVENVTGILAHGTRKCWDDLIACLRGQGYRTADILCNADKLGVPQRRKRVIALAWNTPRLCSVQLSEKNGGTVREALSNVEKLEDHTPRLLPKGSKQALIARQIGPGQKLCNVRMSPKSVHTWDIPSAFGRVTQKERQVLEKIAVLRRRDRQREYGDADPVSMTSISQIIGRAVRPIVLQLIRKGYIRKLDHGYDLTHTFNGKMRRLDWDKPAPTVDTRFGDPWYYLHPSEDRGFSVREAARIQGFPDDFVFEGPIRSQFRVIGNAVPPPLANVLATFVADAILR